MFSFRRSLMYYCHYRNHRSERAWLITTCTAAPVTVTGNNAPVTINQTNVSKCENRVGDSTSPSENRTTSPTKKRGVFKMKKRTQGFKSIVRNVTAGVVMLGSLLDGYGVHSAQSYDF
jgi:hypothetical protein